MSRISRRHTERGQMLVIVAFGMIVLVAMVGLIVDGGNAWGRQRDTQNAADSMAKAGAAVIQSSLGDSSVRDGDVGCAVEAAATQNGVEVEDVVYTTFDGSDLSPAVAVGPCSPGGGPAIPADAQGIRARDAQTFETYLIRVIGFRDVTAYADATAVVGVRTAVCPASAGCGILPVTFPRTLDTCDGTNRQVIGEDEWELIDPAETPLDASNLAIVPLCKKGPGSVGWLDFEGCPNNLQHVIDTPCNVFIPIPSWEHTSTGNTNALEDNLAVYHGDDPGVAEDEDIVVYIPIFDFECRDELADDDPVEDCPSYPAYSGNGSNLYYHIPYWAGFKMDGAFTGGNDRECDQLPGAPFAGGNGATGCLKGWFVELVPAPGPIGVGEINPGDSVSTGILLIE
jgi:hypothetical protein